MAVPGKKKYTYDYPMPSVTVDIVVIAYTRGKSEVLLIKRKHAPHAGKWAIPGGFIEMDETLTTAARRELKEETGIVVKNKDLTLVAVMDHPKRDPRGRVIAMAFMVVVDKTKVKPKAADDAKEAVWHPLHKLPALAFDHKHVFSKVIKAYEQAYHVSLAKVKARGG